MDELKSWCASKAFDAWLWTAINVLGWEHIILWAPDGEDGNVLAITFSMDEGYVDKVCEATDDYVPESSTGETLN